jgi:hypothetical protein
MVSIKSNVWTLLFWCKKLINLYNFDIIIINQKVYLKGVENNF